MKLDEMGKDGYALKAWTIANVKGEPRIVALLDKDGIKHVASCLCTDKILKDAEFNDPVMALSIMEEREPEFREAPK